MATWMCFSKSAQKHGPPSERKPETHAMCWGKLSGESLAADGDFPEIPKFGSTGAAVQALPSCAGPYLQLDLEELRAGVSKSVDVELVRTGIDMKSAYTAILHLRAGFAFPGCGLPMLGGLFEEQRFQASWAAAVAEVARVM